MTSMQLEAGNGLSKASPSPEDLDAALRALSGDDAFLILSQSEQVYLQTTGTTAQGFHLEYRDGSEERHFQSTTSRLPLAVTQEVFRLYAVGDSSWRDKIAWEPWLTGSNRPPRPPIVTAAIVLIVLAVLAWIGWLAIAA